MRKEWTISLGETAEEVARRNNVSRADQDAFALESQQRAARAIAAGHFDQEIVPVLVPAKRGPEIKVDKDEHPRPDTTLETLAAMKPAFRKEGGTVTAGSASGINDGASAVLLMSAELALRSGRKPLARLVATGVAGVAPDVMGLGPIPAVRKALGRAGLTIGQIGLVEINEAFASQVLACTRELGITADRVNVNGGAIALGHPLGASGARVVTTLVHEMQRRKTRFGLATMCIGVGQGLAAIFERVES